MFYHSEHFTCLQLHLHTFTNVSAPFFLFKKYCLKAIHSIMAYLHTSNVQIPTVIFPESWEKFKSYFKELNRSPSKLNPSIINLQSLDSRPALRHWSQQFENLIWKHRTLVHLTRNRKNNLQLKCICVYEVWVFVSCTCIFILYHNGSRTFKPIEENAQTNSRTCVLLRKEYGKK